MLGRQPGLKVQLERRVQEFHSSMPSVQLAPQVRAAALPSSVLLLLPPLLLHRLSYQRLQVQLHWEGHLVMHLDLGQRLLLRGVWVGKLRAENERRMGGTPCRAP